MQIFNFQFKPKLLTTLLFLVFMVIFIRMGMWQASKADAKELKKALYEQRFLNELVRVGDTPINLDESRFGHAVVKGIYEPAYTILIDNRIYKGKAGYHVITPLHISGSNKRILINRGWVPVGNDRNILPVVKSPTGEIEIRGMVDDLASRYLELAQESASEPGWKIVWQNLDMTRYKKAVSFPLQTAIILLDPDSSAGGYIREWPAPDLKIETNRGYAIQWYLMSAALFIIYLVTNIKRIKQE